MYFLYATLGVIPYQPTTYVIEGVPCSESSMCHGRERQPPLGYSHTWQICDCPIHLNGACRHSCKCCRNSPIQVYETDFQSQKFLPHVTISLKKAAATVAIYIIISIFLIELIMTDTAFTNTVTANRMQSKMATTYLPKGQRFLHVTVWWKAGLVPNKGTGHYIITSYTLLLYLQGFSPNAD